MRKRTSVHLLSICPYMKLIRVLEAFTNTFSWLGKSVKSINVHLLLNKKLYDFLEAPPVILHPESLETFGDEKFLK